MAIKKYEFNYNMFDAGATFIVDTDKFTEEHAKATLDFFTWEYNREADPIDEALNKYAMEAIKIATFKDLNVHGVISAFKDNEGFCVVDGSMGIKLISINEFEFDMEFLEVEITIE